MDLVWVMVVGAAAGIGFRAISNLVGWYEYLGGSRRSETPPTSKQVLLDTVLALNSPSRPYRIARGNDTDLVAEWKLDDAEWHGVFQRSRSARAYRACLFADEARHSVRCWEESGRVDWTAGAGGQIPTVSWSRRLRGRVPYSTAYARLRGSRELDADEPGMTCQYRFDVNEIRGPIVVVVERCGWEWVPVAQKRHATYEQPRVAPVPEPTRLEASLFCRHCGVMLEAGSVFCSECGAKVG